MQALRGSGATPSCRTSGSTLSAPGGASATGGGFLVSPRVRARARERKWWAFERRDAPTGPQLDHVGEGVGVRIRPYRPQTNGKAERFIRTLLAGWAYGAIYRSSQERTNALDGWLWHYNHRRRHSALGHQAPISRTNLLGSYI